MMVQIETSNIHSEKSKTFQSFLNFLSAVEGEVMFAPGFTVCDKKLVRNEIDRTRGAITNVSRCNQKTKLRNPTTPSQTHIRCFLLILISVSRFPRKRSSPAMPDVTCIGGCMQPALRGYNAGCIATVWRLLQHSYDGNAACVPTYFRLRPALKRRRLKDDDVFIPRLKLLKNINNNQAATAFASYLYGY